jgi:transcriptional regulator GlxA family with amidase domain
MIIDNGEIITCGGATAFLNLVLYLVERFDGHERTNLAAKVLLVEALTDLVRAGRSLAGSSRL